MTRVLTRGALVLLGLSLAAAARPAAEVGAPAPAFTNPGTDGETWSLEALKGRWVVLEWYNPECPYTQQHYDNGNLPRLQREWTGQDVVWLTVSTNTPAGKAAAYAAEKKSGASAILLDLDARTAAAFDAKTTPHMFVIDPGGVLVYDGAIDDDPAMRSAAPTNYVARALTEARAGRAVSTPQTRPYGCGVKRPRGRT